MFKFRNIFTVLVAVLAIGVIGLPASASAESSVLCPTGNCQMKPAEWVPGTIVAANVAGSHASTTLVKNVPVSKIKKVIRKEEKKKKIKIGFYQNPNGYQGSASCIDPTKVKRWNFHAGEFYKTTNHLREPVPPARWENGDRICDWKEVKINGHRYVTGVQELCANVKSWIPVATTVIKKPKYVYVQYPTIQKYWEIKTKHTEVRSESETGGAGSVAEAPGHWTCPAGWTLEGTMCKLCPPPSCGNQPPCCEPPPCTTCEPPPCSSCEPIECCVKFGNEFEFEEAYVNESPITYYIDIFAPKGHNLSIYFETKGAHFSPHEIKVPSAGAQSKFESQWFAPSHPGQYPVWVKVVDHTSGEICESEVQWVTVHSWELEEPPS